MKKIILIFIVFFCMTEFLNAQNTDTKIYFNGHRVGRLADAGDLIWAGVDSLLVKIDKTSGETINYEIPKPVAFMGSSTSTYFISLDKNGLAWIMCSGPQPYLVIFDGENWSGITQPNTFLSDLIIDKNNKVWLSTYNGLYKYDGTSWIIYDSSNSVIPYSAITSLAVDNQNNKWFGLTPGLGMSPILLVKFDGTQFTKFTSTHLNGVGCTIFSIAVCSDGIIWMGTHENGLIKFDGVNWEVFNSSNSGLPDNSIRNVTVESDTVIWIITGSGLTRYDGENWSTFNTENSVLPSNKVNSILIDEDGIKWVGTDEGLVSFNDNQLKTSIKKEQKIVSQFDLFPNPANEYINLKLPSKLIGSTIQIIDTYGKLLKDFIVYNVDSRFDISVLPNGIYFIKIQMDNETILKKFVKLRAN